MPERYVPEEAGDFVAPDVGKSQEKPHLTQFGGKQYEVGKLKSVAEQLPTTEYPLGDRSALEDILESKYWNTSDGQSIGPSDLLAAFEQSGGDWNKVKEAHLEWSVHVDKVMRVDYRFPSLMHDGHLIDGIHRLTKALSENALTLPVKVLDELPSSTEYSE